MHLNQEVYQVCEGMKPYEASFLAEKRTAASGRAEPTLREPCRRPNHPGGLAHLGRWSGGAELRGGPVELG